MPCDDDLAFVVVVASSSYEEVHPNWHDDVFQDGWVVVVVVAVADDDDDWNLHDGRRRIRHFLHYPFVVDVVPSKSSNRIQ